MTYPVKGLPQYNYPKPSGNIFSYDRPNDLGNFNGPSSINQINYNNLNEDYNYNEQNVQKHIYVHAPPPELDYSPQKAKRPRPVRPVKHYKIVFIKAPTPAPPVNIPAPPQVEEKTLVYVLVKKPEDAKDITIPPPEPTEPSKPEVYFIRYKSKKDEIDDEAENGYERKIEVDEERKDYKRPSYLPPLTQLFSSPLLQLHNEDVY